MQQQMGRDADNRRRRMTLQLRLYCHTALELLWRALTDSVAKIDGTVGEVTHSCL